MKKIIITSLLLLISCGSRKVEVEKTDLKTAELTKVDIDTKITAIDICDMLEIEPIDTTKPIIINGFTYKNAKIKRKQSRTETKTEIKDKSTIDKKTSLKTAKKQIDRKSNSVLWLWLIILILFFLIIYRKKLA